MSILLLATVALSGTPFKEVSFGASPSVRDVEVVAPAAQATPPIMVPRAALPATGPVLPARGSRFSTLLRARAVLDLEQTPAGSVAKLFRLDAAGKRTTSACTATFIGPRHLITAGHCIVDFHSGAPHPRFELATRYDAGTSTDGPPLPVLRAWVPADQWILAKPEDALVTADRCSDYAVLEVPAPPGPMTWLQLRASPAAGPMHRFSYPHRSIRDVFSGVKASSDDERAAIAQEIEKGERQEPAFRSTDLYYEYGFPDIAEPSHFGDRSRQVVTGQSGSALLDSEAAIVAILSRDYEDVTYSCRLRPQEIAAIQAIVAGKASGQKKAPGEPGA